MSWAAHEFESYILHKHVRTRASFSGILLGCFLPDLLTKLPVYGVSLGPIELEQVSEPWMYHRGWPGVGPTHSFLFIAVVSLVVLAIWRHRGFSLGLLLGGWAHVLTDCFDSAGTMLFFPFTTNHYSFGMWAYAAQEGRYGDASAYYSSLGGIWDLLWLVLCLLNLKVFSTGYFEEHVEPHDPFWRFLRQRLGLGTYSLVVIYRAYALYGTARVLGWTLWARFVNPLRSTESFDITWGGPSWVQAAPPFQRASSPGEFALVTVLGVAGTAGALAAMWFLAGRWAWRRADAVVAADVPAIQTATDGTNRSANTGQ